jgi:hypothetical protein
MTLNEKIIQLENKILTLESKIQDLSQNVEESPRKPYSISGGGKSLSSNRATDIRTGRNAQLSGAVLWNDAEMAFPPLNTEPDIPTEGYNKHSHSRFSGGALIKDVLEIVEYEWGAITNKHCQQFFYPEPKIKKEINSYGESVDKIGLLDLVFNPDTGTWGVAAYEIDVKRCYLVERDENGDIAVDSKGQEKKSLLYNEDATKSSIVWDENAGVFRFYAVYAPGSD